MKDHLETRLIHAGEPAERIEGAVITPIFQSATFEHAGEGGYYDVRYIRLNNTPSHEVLHAKLAALENGEAALVAASGMAAISTTLLTLLQSGDHLLAQRGLYGGTYDFITRDLPRLGIDFDFFDPNGPQEWASLLRPQTRMVYVESLSNPLLEVADLRGLVEFARSHKLVSAIDNTFASPVNLRPLELGFDLVLHSGTKYLNGHSDIVAGALVGRSALVEPVRHTLARLGGSLDPHACFLLERGIKTLAVRVRQQNQSALEIARFLESHPGVRRVHYPGLESHPQHERARQLFEGFSGMLSLELEGGLGAARRFLAATRLATVAPSLGGVESLITLPATTSHAGMEPEERRALGISDELVRISVGLEHSGDLIRDFSQALEAAGSVEEEP